MERWYNNEKFKPRYGTSCRWWFKDKKSYADIPYMVKITDECGTDKVPFWRYMSDNEPLLRKEPRWEVSPDEEYAYWTSCSTCSYGEPVFKKDIFNWSCSNDICNKG